MPSSCRFQTRAYRAGHGGHDQSNDQQKTKPDKTVSFIDILTQIPRFLLITQRLLPFLPSERILLVLFLPPFFAAVPSRLPHFAGAESASSNGDADTQEVDVEEVSQADEAVIATDDFHLIVMVDGAAVLAATKVDDNEVEAEVIP